MEKKRLTKTDVAELYNQWLGEWLLLEILETEEDSGKAKTFVLMAHHSDKKELYKLMEGDDWNWDKKYLFVLADPQSLCEI